MPARDESHLRKMVALDDDDAALTCVGGGAKAALGAIEAIAKQFEANRAAAGILERLEKLERADAEKSERLDRMELQIESLSHNLSGVADDAARRAKEEAERKQYKALLLGRQLAGMAKIKAGAKAAAERARQRLAAARESGEEPVDLGAGFKADGAPRNPEAIKRWHWAFRQIKLKRKLAKLGADVRCAPRNSVAERLKAMEELVGNLRNRIEYYEKQEETRAESPGPDADTQNAMLRFEYQLEKQAEQTQGLGERVDGIDGRLREVSTNVEQLSSDVASSIEGLGALREAQLANSTPKDITQEVQTLEGLARDAVPIIEGRAPLIAFVSDLVGEAALQDAAADTGEDAALFVKPTICDAASAPSVERLAWACYRLLDSDVQDLLEEYEGPRTAVRGPFGKTLRAVYDALLNALETVTSPAAVKLDVRALETRSSARVSSVWEDLHALESDAKSGMDALGASLNADVRAVEEKDAEARRELEERASELEEASKSGLNAVEQDVRALEYRIEAEAAAARAKPRSPSPNRPRTAERPRTPGANAAGDALVRKLDQVASLADDAQRRSLEALPRSAFEEFRQEQSREAAERARKKAAAEAAKAKRRALREAEAAAAAAAADDASFATQESAPAGYLLKPKQNIKRRPKNPQELFDDLYEPVRPPTAEETLERQRALMVKILSRMANVKVWGVWNCWYDATQKAKAAEAQAKAAAEAERQRLEAERMQAEIERLEAARLAAEGAEADRLAAEAEKARLDAERLERERLEAERLEAERLEAQRLEAERREAERLAEAERRAAEEAARRVDRAASPIPVEEETQTIEERPSIESFETGTDTFDLVERFKGPAGASRDEVKALEKRLVEALASVEGRLAELSATSSDMGQKVPELRDALTLLGSQLASMQHSKADRGKTERQLKSKVDRDEIDDIAARLAGDKDDDLDPTLVAKQQVPALKCLSCDRPLTLAPRTEAGIFPPAAYAGAAPSKVESLGRGPTPLDALYAAGARPRSSHAPLLRPPPGTSQNLLGRYPPLNGTRSRPTSRAGGR